MTTYLVTHREVRLTTYQVEAEDEEDAIEAVQAGDGFLVGQETEPYLDPDEWEAANA